MIPPMSLLEWIGLSHQRTIQFFIIVEHPIVMTCLLIGLAGGMTLALLAVLGKTYHMSFIRLHDVMSYPLKHHMT